ncbi:hypothetical protein BGX33_008283 [Mortierella sp. NVP41]|nr:hypothetical protein BGX33_008283 [Mortierella sp. NVP41]
MVAISKSICSVIAISSVLLLSVISLQAQAAPALVPDSVNPADHAAYLRIRSACKARCYVAKFDEADHHDLSLEVDKCVAQVSAANPKSMEGVFHRNNNPYCFLQDKDRLTEEEDRNIHQAWAICARDTCVGY